MFARHHLLAALAFFPTALCSVEFINHGTTDGWSSVPFVENKGKVNTVDNVAYPNTPGTSIKFE